MAEECKDRRIVLVPLKLTLSQCIKTTDLDSLMAEEGKDRRIVLVPKLTLSQCIIYREEGGLVLNVLTSTTGPCWFNNEIRVLVAN